MIWLYFVIVGGLTCAAYSHYHELWLRRERARTTMGVGLVLFTALPFAVAGLLDWITWAVLFGGFGLAGSITVYMDIQSETNGAESLRRLFRDAESDD